MSHDRNGDGVAFGPYRLDVNEACLWHGGKRVPLSVTDGAILHYLASRSGRLVTRDELLAAVWPGVAVSPGVVKVRVRRLRRVLGDRVTRPRFIETVHGRGYRFKASVRAASPHGATPLARRDPSCIVGRETELEWLQNHVERALAGRRQTLFIAAPAGAGKSALVREFLARCVDAERIWVGHGQCIENLGPIEPYMPVLEALGRACRGPGGRALQRGLRRLAPSWLAQMPALIGAREAAVLEARSAGAAPERVVRELTEALDIITRDRPLLLWLDDLHWSDVSSIALLSALSRRMEAARLAIVATYRPADARGNPIVDVVAELTAQGCCQSLPLGNLDAAAIGAYLCARFPGHAFPASFVERLYARTEGHPLFLVALVNDLVANGDVEDTGGQWTLRTAVSALERSVPDTIRQLVDRQRQRLSRGEHEVLAAASVAGLIFATPLVAAALNRPSKNVEETCAELAERQLFLRREALVHWADGTVAATYAFLHGVYRTLWQERARPTVRREWHRRLAERLVRAHGAEIDEVAGEVAMHFEAAGEDRETFRYLRRAMTQAMRRRAPHEAIALARRALALVASVVDAGERARAEREIRIALGRLELVRRGHDAPEVVDNYARLRALCEERAEDSHVFPALVAVVRFELNRAEIRAARRLAAHAYRLAKRERPRDLAGAHTMLGVAAFNAGRLARADQHLARALSLHEHAHSQALARVYGESVEVPSQAYRALVLWHRGLPRYAVRASGAALRTARELGLPAPRSFALGMAAHLHRLRQEPEMTLRLATELRALAADDGFPFWLAQATFELGWAITALGRIDEGRTMMQDGLDQYRGTGARMHEVGNRVAWLDVVGPDGSDGREVDQLLATIRRTGQRCHESPLHRLKGEWLLRHGRDDAAAESLQRAIDVAASQGAEPLKQRARAALERLHARARGRAPRT